MSIIGNYVRMTADELANLKPDTEVFQKIVTEKNQSDLCFDLDQYWDALAWLLSNSSREKAKINYQWLLLAEGKSADVPIDAASIPADEMEQAFKGGSNKLTGIDFGYGLASVVDALTARRISESLATITAEDLLDRFEPSKMLGVYPDGWQDSDPSLMLDALVPAYHRFRDFYKSAAGADDAVVVFFN